MAAPFPGGPHNTLCGIIGSDAPGDAIAEDGSQEAQRSRRGAFATLHNGAAALFGFDVRGCLAADNIVPKLGDVAFAQIPHRPAAEKGLDVPFDPSRIGVDGRRLDAAAPSHKLAGIGLGKVFVAQPGHGHRRQVGGALLSRIAAVISRGQEMAARLRASSGVPDAIPPNGQPARPPMLVAVLNQEAFGAGWLHSDTEPGKLVIPCEHVAVGQGLEAINRLFGQVGHSG